MERHTVQFYFRHSFTRAPREKHTHARTHDLVRMYKKIGIRQGARDTCRVSTPEHKAVQPNEESSAGERAGAFSSR